MFIIIGVLLLVAGGIYFYYSSSQTESTFGQDVTRITTEVPVEFEPLNAFVENCLIQTAENGLILIGEHGGYIDVSSRNFKITNDPTNSDAVKFSENSELAIPYWYYLESDNQCAEDCILKFGYPNLYRQDGEPSIEKQLDTYIEQNIDSCLNNFEFFIKGGYEIKTPKQPKVTTTVTETDVNFYLEYRIDAKRESSKTIEEYNIIIPVNLKQIYEQAIIITSLQAEFKYIEKSMVNVLYSFSALDPDKLPPFSEYAFEFGSGIQWNKNEIEIEVQQILSSYVQFLQVLGSDTYDSYNFPRGSFEDALYNANMLIVDEDISSDISFMFTYIDFWPIYFDMNCNDDLCKADIISLEFLPIIGIQKYEFYYDVSFPLLVELHDKDAFNNRGFDFNFFLEANIRNNEPMKSDFVQISFPSIDQSLLCDHKNRHSGTISLNIKDSLNNDVDGADIIYSCADQGCSIGKSIEGIYEDKFPVCLGGIVTVLADGYVGESQLLSTELDQEETVNVVLDPIKTINFEILKYKARKENSWNIDDTPSPFTIDESAVIMLERLGSINEKEFGSYVILDKGQQTGQLELAPGNYKLEIQLQNDEILLIPEDERKVGSFPFEEEINIPEVKLDESYISGGVLINFTVEPNDIEKSSVTFYIINPDLLGVPVSNRVVEDLDQLNKIAEYSNKYPLKLKPKFID